MTPKACFITYKTFFFHDNLAISYVMSNFVFDMVVCPAVIHLTY